MAEKVVYIQERHDHWFLWIGEKGDGGQGLIQGMRFFETGEEAVEAAQKTELPVVKLLVLKT